MSQLPTIAVDKSYFQAATAKDIEKLALENILFVPSAYYYEVFSDDHVKRFHSSKNARFQRLDIYTKALAELQLGRPLKQVDFQEGRVNPITYEPDWQLGPDNESTMAAYKAQAVDPMLKAWQKLVQEEGSWFPEDVLKASRQAKDPLGYLCDLLRQNHWGKTVALKLYHPLPDDYDGRWLGYCYAAAAALQSVLVRQHWPKAMSVIDANLLLHDTLDTEYLACGLFVGRLATNDKRIAKRFRTLMPDNELKTVNLKI